MKNTIIILLLFFTSYSCDSTKKPEETGTGMSTKVPNDYFINAALFNYYTAEYKALTYQAFNSAANYLELLKIKNPKRKDLAVVLDIDETLLDNSPYQAMLFKINASYDSLWNEWCNLEAAKPVPGAVEFLQIADSLGFNIYYITNRKLNKVYASTLKNLQNAGFPQADSMHLMMRDEGSGKEKRRMKVEANNDIVMLVGDNIGDFYEDTRDYSVRESTVNSHKPEFGSKLIILPNAMYGNWVESLGIYSKSDVDSLVSLMTAVFNK